MNILAIVSSHYHKMVSDLAQESEQDSSSGLQLAHMQCYEEPDENDPTKIKNVTCLYKLDQGICPQSHGFACARKAEISEQVVEEGKVYAEKLARMTAVFEKVIEACRS